MLTRSLNLKKNCFIAIAGVLLISIGVLPALAEKWSQRYIESLPDSAFAAIEISKEGKKIRHLPHHDHLGELDIPHLKSALGRIHQVKWIDPSNFGKAKTHLEQHFRDYQEERVKAQRLRGPININRTSTEEFMQLPHIGEKRALAIIEYRKSNGNLKKTSELMRVPGIDPKIFADIEDLVTVE